MLDPAFRYRRVGPSASVIGLQFLSAERFGCAVGLWFQIRGDNGLARGRVGLVRVVGSHARGARDVGQAARVAREETTGFISTISLPGLFVETAAVTLLRDVNARCEIRAVVLM